MFRQRYSKWLQCFHSHRAFSDINKRITFGIIIIGDEILKGQVCDINSHFLTKNLFSLGISVDRISVISDQLNDISSEIRTFSSKYTYVITSGGIGPTHDDLTFEGAAEAFAEKVHLHPQLSQIIKKYFNELDYSSPKFKLATIPQSAELVYHPAVDPKTSYPVVKVRNVFILPGVPSLLERAFGIIKHQFESNMNKCVKNVYINADELLIAHIIDNVVSKFQNEVTVGSYPEFDNRFYKTKLTLEADSPDILSDVYHYITTLLPSNEIVNYYSDPIANAASYVYSFAETNPHLKKSLLVIEECFERYPFQEISLAFNGGKDCTALLHLTHSVIRKKYPNMKSKLKVVYLRKGEAFPEVENFIKKSVQQYNLDLITINGGLKESLEEYKQIRPEIKSIMMGTRSTDPYSSNLTSFDHTDSDWPEFMRVSPILEWCYSDVWGFLRSLCIPYCNLYDIGYTSLGNMDNSKPNQKLKEVDNNGIIRYKPAYLLEEDQFERDGRMT